MMTEAAFKEMVDAHRYDGSVVIAFDNMDNLWKLELMDSAHNWSTLAQGATMAELIENHKERL